MILDKKHVKLMYQECVRQSTGWTSTAPTTTAAASIIAVSSLQVAAVRDGNELFGASPNKHVQIIDLARASG